METENRGKVISHHACILAGCWLSQVAGLALFKIQIGVRKSSLARSLTRRHICFE